MKKKVNKLVDTILNKKLEFEQVSIDSFRYKCPYCNSVVIVDEHCNTPTMKSITHSNNCTWKLASDIKYKNNNKPYIRIHDFNSVNNSDIIGFIDKRNSSKSKGYIIFIKTNHFTAISIESMNIVSNIAYGLVTNSKAKTQMKAIYALTNKHFDAKFKFYKFKTQRDLHKWLIK